MSATWKPIGRTVVKDPEIVAHGVIETDESVALADRCTRRFLIWRCDDYWMDWEVHESSGCEMDGTPIFGEMTDIQHEPCADSMLMEGSLKWDHCCQWHDGGRGWHYDNLKDVPDIRDIIRQLHRIASYNMTRWDQ